MSISERLIRPPRNNLYRCKIPHKQVPDKRKYVKLLSALRVKNSKKITVDQCVIKPLTGISERRKLLNNIYLKSP